MIKVETREVFITEDGREFSTRDEAYKHDRTRKIRVLINFPCKQDDVVAQWIEENYFEIRKIMEG